MASFSRPLAVALLIGTALLGLGATLHPMLPPDDVPGQLRMIAATPSFRAVHLAMLCGTGLIIAGVWTRLLVGQASDRSSLRRFAPPVGVPSAWRSLLPPALRAFGRSSAFQRSLRRFAPPVGVPPVEPGTPTPLIGALALVCLGLCFNAIDIAFMGGAGWHLANAYVAGQRELAPLFEALHRFGLLTARFGNFLVALGALVLGFAERRDPASPRWMAWLAWTAAAGGFAGVLLVPEASLLMLTAVTLISGWSVGTVVRVMRE